MLLIVLSVVCVPNEENILKIKYFLRYLEYIKIHPSKIRTWFVAFNFTSCKVVENYILPKLFGRFFCLFIFNFKIIYKFSKKWVCIRGKEMGYQF